MSYLGGLVLCIAVYLFAVFLFSTIQKNKAISFISLILCIIIYFAAGLGVLLFAAVHSSIISTFVILYWLHMAEFIYKVKQGK